MNYGFGGLSIFLLRRQKELCATLLERVRSSAYFGLLHRRSVKEDPAIVRPSAVWAMSNWPNLSGEAKEQTRRGADFL